MFRVGLTPQALDEEVASLAARVEPSTVGHWQDLGFAHGIHPLTSNRHCVGSAYTVRLAGMDATAIHAAMADIGPGHVLVVSMGGERQRACVGAIIGWLAERSGATGVVVDGMATDLEDLEQLGIPVFARGTSALTTKAIGIEGDINVPVVIDNVIVNPGDVVIADPNGVLFIAPSDFAQTAARAIEAQEAETRFRSELAGGADLAQISGAKQHMQGRIVTVSRPVSTSDYDGR
ncbi:MAG: RraA family protein [Mycetocola sp.]